MDGVLRLRGGTSEVGLAVMGGGVLCERTNDEGAALHQRSDYFITVTDELYQWRCLLLSDPGE